ncbi:MAG: dihydroxyacetone kinase subunit DhaK [Candidatus Binatia bacterium]
MPASANGRSSGRHDAGSLRVGDLVEAFEVSDETIRRDLAVLEEQGFLTRTHGGAIAEGVHRETTFQRRAREFVTEKDAIARAAAELVEDGSTIILDSGTTMRHFAKHLRHKRDLVVITNGINNTNELLANPSLTLVVTGGVVRRATEGATGELAVATLKSLRADHTFIATQGFSAKGGMTYPSFEEVAVKRALIESGAQVTLLADGSEVRARIDGARRAADRRAADHHQSADPRGGAGQHPRAGHRASLSPARRSPCRPSRRRHMSGAGLIKKLINDPAVVVDEFDEAALEAHPDSRPLPGRRAVQRAASGARKGAASGRHAFGGGLRHEPAFLGYVGPGLADSAAVGNVLAAPSADAISVSIEAANHGAGVILMYGNYSGDVLNCRLASRRPRRPASPVRSLFTTDDVALGAAGRTWSPPRHRRRSTGLQDRWRRRRVGLSFDGRAHQLQGQRRAGQHGRGALRRGTAGCGEA